MSKIRTNNLQARSDDGTITIGATHEDGKTNYSHTTRIIGGVDIEGYASKKYVLEHLLSDGVHTEDIVMKEEAGQPGGYARLTTDTIPQVDWYDMKNTIRDNHYDYRVNMSHSSIDSSIQSLKEDVITLEGEIESIITLDEKGSWLSTPNDPPESGKVNFSSTDFTTSPMTVKISKLDTDGTSHTFATAGVGTWIEFVEDDQDYCLGQITAVDNDDDDFFLTTFDVSVAKGEVVDDSSVKIRLFEAADDFDPASIRIVDIDTTPPIEPNEGALWFDNNEEDMTLRVYQQASEAWIPVAPATTIEGRVNAGEALQAEIRSGLSALEAQVSSSLVEQNRIKHQPPGVKFTYQDGSSGLTEKHFLLWESGGDKRIRISSKGVDVDWLDQGINPDYTMNDGPYFSIYYMPSIASANDRVKWRQRWHGRVSRIDWHTNDILVYVSSWHAYGTLAADADYFITIGGIL